MQLKAANFFQHVVRMYKGLAVHLHDFYASKNRIYSIVELDMRREEVAVSCKGTKTVLNLKLKKAIFDVNLIIHMFPVDACLVGIICGDMLSKPNLAKELEVKIKPINKLSLYKTGYRFKFIFEDLVSGLIGYMDTITKETVIKQAREFAFDNRLIAQFEPSQAYHIGIVAGRLMAKELEDSQRTISSRPVLRLVK